MAPALRDRKFRRVWGSVDFHGSLLQSRACRKRKDAEMWRLKCELRKTVVGRRLEDVRSRGRRTSPQDPTTRPGIPGPLSYYLLKKSQKNFKNNNPCITLIRDNILYFLRGSPAIGSKLLLTVARLPFFVAAMGSILMRALRVQGTSQASS